MWRTVSVTSSTSVRVGGNVDHASYGTVNRSFVSRQNRVICIEGGQGGSIAVDECLVSLFCERFKLLDCD